MRRIAVQFGIIEKEGDSSVSKVMESGCDLEEIIANNPNHTAHSSLLKAYLLQRYPQEFPRGLDNYKCILPVEFKSKCGPSVYFEILNETKRENISQQNNNKLNIIFDNNNNCYFYSVNGNLSILKFSASHSSKPNCIVILLSMPVAVYPVELYNHQQILQTVTERNLKEWIVSHQLCLPHKTLTLENIPEIKRAFFIAAPLLLKSSHKFYIFLKFMVCHWIMDDFIVKSVTSNQIPVMSPAFFKDLRKIVTNILSCQYRHVDAVPYFDFPIFHHCLKALFEVCQELVENVEPEYYEKFHSFLLGEMMDWVEWHKINSCTFSAANYDGGSSQRIYFQRTKYEKLRYFRGPGVMLELIQLLHGASLDESIRHLKIFKLFCDTAVSIHGMAMETLSREHVELYQSPVDPINDAIMDFRGVEKTLRRGYASSDRVLRFLKNTQYFVDGTIRALMNDW